MTTKTPAMTFHESYGSLPKAVLAAIRKYNVSPADFDFMLDQFSENDWAQIHAHILDNSSSGMYAPRFF